MPSPIRTITFLCIVALLAAAPGCVRRRLTVRSNPPGAVVYVDNQQIGETPCATDFTYYGTRKIRLEKAGYETLSVKQPIPTPWYETPGIDFISENLIPLRIRDNRNVAFDLAPQRMVPAEELIGRAEQLRREAQPNGLLTPGAALPPGSPVSPGTVLAPVGSSQANGVGAVPAPQTFGPTPAVGGGGVTPDAGLFSPPPVPSTPQPQPFRY